MERRTPSSAVTVARSLVKNFFDGSPDEGVRGSKNLCV